MNPTPTGEPDVGKVGQGRPGILKTRQPIGRADKVYDKKTRKWRLHRPSGTTNPERYKKFVIVSARIFSLQGAFTGKYDIQISSRSLCDLLRRMSDLPFNPGEGLTEYEQCAFYHALPILEDRVKNLKPSGEASDLLFELDAGVKFICEHWGREMEQLKSAPKGKVMFDHLWTLFPPRCLIYGMNELGESQIYRLRNYRYQENSDKTVDFILCVEYIDFDGKCIGYVAKYITIKSFPSSTHIAELPVYPFMKHSEYTEERGRLLERSVKALRLRGRHLQEYKGLGLERVETRRGYELRKFNSHGRIMLDPLLFKEVSPITSFVPTIWQPIDPNTLEEDRKLTMTSVLYGFSLGDKIWGAFAVDRLEEIKWNQQALDDVEMEEDKKSFLKSLVQTHSSDGKFDDVIRDKGKGLVGLLAGPPGVGKTLTAEAIAEHAKRPLVSLTSGDMGNNGDSVQKRLDQEFELAEAWNAVLLLDEADVFMTRRSMDNIAQNAITSVFLRKLEYYRGILLLTTNRLKSFDKAFESRLHFYFEYPNLTESARRRIWDTFLRKAAGTDVFVEVSEEQRGSLAKKILNGRQIKNIVGTACAHARQTTKVVSLGVVEQAANFQPKLIEESEEDD